MVKIKRRKRSGILYRAAAAVLGSFVLIVIFADFLSPYDHAVQSRSMPSAPPTTIRFRDEGGNLQFRPFIYRRTLIDPLEGRYSEESERKFEIGLFVNGEPYRFLGLFNARLRLFGLIESGPDIPRINLLGTDQLGRDRFSRLLVATKFSLIVCPIGALLAWLIGVVIGSISGYAGRFSDMALMGVADTMLALPTLILILAARAAFPLELPPMRAAGLLIGIFALTGWAEIARLTRGLVRSLKEREFVLAARSIGLTETRILFRHIFPNSLPTLLTQATLMLPFFLLSETALSFLGIGLQEPQPSLGNMLTTAADLNQLQRDPLLVLSPAFVIVAFVLAIQIFVQSRGSQDRRTYDPETSN